VKCCGQIITRVGVMRL